MSEQIIDLDDVLGRIQGDKELLVELIEIFLDDCPQKINDIKECVERGNLDQLSEAAHSAKGAAANIGAKKLWKTFLEAEEAAKSGAIDQFEEMIVRIDQEFDELKQYFPELKEKLA
ncbi:MAG: Hpt domain-containing protein [Candidatus Omnitrophica bacterium]|nr:Hpt domain-containing protein [Candidatus Omnitrophota bacterium]